MLRSTVSALLLLGLLLPGLAATDGYFDYGYGVKAKGGGGAGVAFPQDGLAPATNPAGNAFVSDQVDAGVTYFAPDRSASYNGTGFDGNGTDAFWIPEAGWRQGLGQDASVGLAVYGNGGMNTSYDKPIFGTTKTGIDLTQLFVAATGTYTIADRHALGVSAIYAYQTFKATGLENFAFFDPAFARNPGTDTSHGFGFRIGYTGRITDWLSLGVTYQSRINTTPFAKYQHLFAEHGDFDIPANYAAGLAIRPTASTTIAVDVERIRYSSVASVGNPATPATLGAGFGASDGPGFGWRDVTAIKIGLSQQIGESLTVRVGYNHSSQPIPEDQTPFNILAPAVVQHHYTAGASLKLGKDLELSAFYAHVPESEIKGAGSQIGFGNADLKMSQKIAGIGASLNL